MGGLSWVLVGCGDGGMVGEPIANQATALARPAVALPGDELGTVVVSRTMHGGNTQQISDLGEHGAMVMATGEAPNPPTWQPSKQTRPLRSRRLGGNRARRVRAANVGIATRQAAERTG